MLLGGRIFGHLKTKGFKTQVAVNILRSEDFKIQSKSETVEIK